MSASSARCAVCVEPVRDQGARCPRCGVFYHPACFSEGGCVVPGCTPGRTAEAAVRMNSRLWGPAVSSMVFACALAYLTVEVAWGGPWELRSKIAVAFALAAWVTGAAGMIAAGFRDIGWHIPPGATHRPDRLGTIALMMFALVAEVAGAGLALALLDSPVPGTGVLQCVWGTTCATFMLSVLGLGLDVRRVRAVVALLAVTGLIAAFGFADSTPAASARPQLPAPRSGDR